MKVKAISLGYYQGLGRVRPGTIFQLDKKEHFSKKWMEEVDEKEKVTKNKTEHKKPALITGDEKPSKGNDKSGKGKGGKAADANADVI